MKPILPTHPTLAAQGRWTWGVDRAAAIRETTAVVGCGVAAALFSDLDFVKGLPGHAILRVVPFFALGLMFAPRRGTGTSVGLAAMATTIIRMLFGVASGAGALTSLSVLGPCLDLAMLPVKRGRGAYIAFAIAGVAANLAALIAQGFVKYHWPRGRLPFEQWLATSAISYPAFGLLAGLIAAAICFRWRDSSQLRNES